MARSAGASAAFSGGEPSRMAMGPGGEQLSLFGEPAEPAVAPPKSASPGPASRVAASPVATPPRVTAEAARRPPGDDWARALAACADLEALQRLVVTCSRCGLRQGCRQVVFGEGNSHARVMLVGEGPGQVEDETGRPFVGPAGQLLDRMLAAIGLQRGDVYIANVVKCRPPGNRVPTADEAAMCWPNLRRQLELIRPEFVVCLGATAARQLVDARGSLSGLRGRWHVRDGVRYLVTFHPAALLRDPGKKPLAWHDLQMLQHAMDGASQAPPG